MRIKLEEPHMDNNLEKWWSAVRARVRTSDRRKFDALIILVARTLWKQRNAQVFGNVQQQWSTERIVDSIQDKFRMWVLAFAGGNSTLTRD
jgi:hypothetical protein